MCKAARDKKNAKKLWNCEKILVNSREKRSERVKFRGFFMIFYVVAKIVGFASVFSGEVWVEVGVENWHLKSDWWDWGGKGALTCQAPAIRQSWHNCNNPLWLLLLPLPCLPANDIITITLNIIATIWRQKLHSAAQPDTSLMSPGQAAPLRIIRIVRIVACWMLIAAAMRF